MNIQSTSEKNKNLYSSAQHIFDMQDDEPETLLSQIEELCSSTDEEVSDQESESSSAPLQLVAKSQAAPLEFPELSWVKYMTRGLQQIPKDYQFSNLESYQTLWERLERECFFDCFRQSLNAKLIKGQVDPASPQSTFEGFQLLKSYDVLGSSFQPNGLAIKIRACVRIQRYQLKQWEIINNQLMFLVNKFSKKIYMGKTIEVEKEFDQLQQNQKNAFLANSTKESTNNRCKNQQSSNKRSNGQNRKQQREEDEESKMDQEEIKEDPFEYIVHEEIFKLKINISNGSLDEIFQNLDYLSEQFYLVNPHQYWYSLQTSQNCKRQFKQSNSIAFEDQTLYGEKGTKTFPKYEFLQGDEDLTARFQEEIEEAIKKENKLDEYQKIALRHALYNQNAIIQGPPGTGKTYLASRLVGLLKNLHHRHVKRPIIVISKKNLSLDQLLVKIYQENSGIKMLRLGYRSTLEEIINAQLLEKEKEPKKEKFSDSTLHSKSKKINEGLNEYKMKSKKRNQNWCFKPEFRIEELRTLLTNKLVSLLVEALNLSDEEENIDDEFSKKLFDKWIKGKITSSKITKYLNNIYIELDDEQTTKLESIVEEQSSYTKLQRFQSAKQVKDYIREKINSFEQLTDTLANYLMSNQDSLEIDMVLDKMKEYETKMQTDQQKCEKKYQDDFAEFIQKEEYEVIGMTLSGYHKYYAAISQLNVEIVVVEEASEIIESEFYPVLTPSLKHLIQIGDHMQLRPIIMSENLKFQFNYRLSYFERLISVNKVDYVTLYKQRRMLTTLANFTRIFYGDEYKDDQSTYERNILKSFSSHSMYMHQHSYPEQQMQDCSFINYYEALFIKNLAKDLVEQQKKFSQTITILTMYKSQKILIQSMIDENKNLNSILVETIDAFQGNENEIIILSCVRSNENFKNGFINNDQRINVAFSRARSAFFCVGNFKQYQKKSQTWRKINELAEKQFSFGGLSRSSLAEKIHEKTEYDQSRYFQKYGIESEQLCNLCDDHSHIGDCCNMERQIQQQQVQPRPSLQNCLSSTNIEMSFPQLMRQQSQTQNVEEQNFQQQYLDSQPSNMGFKPYVLNDKNQIVFDQWTPEGRENIEIEKYNKQVQSIYDNITVQDKSLSQKQRKQLARKNKNSQNNN